MSSKTAIITGATKGLGLETSLAFARAGYAVVATYKTDTHAAEQLQADLAQEGAVFRVVQSDVSDENAKELWSFPEITTATSLVLVNNACAGFQPEPMHRVNWTAVETQLDVGLKGAWISSQAVLRQMVKSKSGTIVNVLTSAVDGLPPKGFSAYVIAKHALRGLTLSLASEFSSRGIRVFSVSPGYMDTAFTKIWDSRLRDAITSSEGRISSTSEAGKRIVELVESSASPGVGEDHPI